MAITADMNSKNYTLGRGKVLVGRYAQNADISTLTQSEGLRYIGNSPEFSTSGSAEDLDHFDSDAGVKVKDDSVQLSMDRSGKFTCDNIDAGNIAMMFLGQFEQVAVAADPTTLETMTVKRGRQYQIGVTEVTPSGHRRLTVTTVKTGTPGFATTVTMSGNYQYDSDLGLLYIEEDAPDIADDTVIQIDYALLASTREQVVSGSDSIYAEIKFIADNPKGTNRDYFYPYVKISPDGDYNLKGDDWQTMSFTFEILKKGTLEAVYVDSRAVAP